MGRAEGGELGFGYRGHPVDALLQRDWRWRYIQQQQGVQLYQRLCCGDHVLSGSEHLLGQHLRAADGQQPDLQLTELERIRLPGHAGHERRVRAE